MSTMISKILVMLERSRYRRGDDRAQNQENGDQSRRLWHPDREPCPRLIAASDHGAKGLTEK